MSTFCLGAILLFQLHAAAAGRRQRVLASPDIPVTAFSCTGRPVGYYADLETNCQVYHMCGEGERQYSYMCPNTTLFHQRMLICAHWYQVNCSRSEMDYSANLLIGQRDKPFVPDYFSGLGEDGVDAERSNKLENRRTGKAYSLSKDKDDLQTAGSGSLLAARQNALPEPTKATTPSTVSSRPTNVSFRSTIETPSSDPALARTQPMTRPPKPTPRTILRPRRPSLELEPPDSKLGEGNTLELHLQDPRRAFYIPEGTSALPKDEPIVVSIRLRGESAFGKRNCQRCHPLFLVDKANCSPCVLSR